MPNLPAWFTSAGKEIEPVRPTSAQSDPFALDPLDYFPEVGEAVSIHFEGFERGFRYLPVEEPIWCMVSRAMMFATGTEVEQDTPEEVCKKFTIISWDPIFRRLDVKLN